MNLMVINYLMKFMNFKLYEINDILYIYNKKMYFIFDLSIFKEYFCLFLVFNEFFNNFFLKIIKISNYNIVYYITKINFFMPNSK